MRKKGSIVEFALLLVFISVVSVASLFIYNNNKLRLTELSTVEVRETESTSPTITLPPTWFSDWLSHFGL